MVCGVVVAGLEIIEAGFVIVDVASITNRVAVDEAVDRGAISCGGFDAYVAPSVVGVVKQCI